MKIVLFANTDWYLWNFRRSLAISLRDQGHEVILVSPVGPYGQRLLDIALDWHPVPMRRSSLNPLRELQLVLHLMRLFRSKKPDLVHGFTIKCAVYGALAARAAGVHGRVSSVAGLGYVFTSNSAKARALRPVVRVLLKLALGGKNARLILQNPDDVELFLKSRLVGPADIRLIPGSGVDCHRFRPANGTNSFDTLRVLLPARLLWDKGLAEYIAAARQLRAEGRVVEFLLAGKPDPGNPASVLESQVREWAEEGVITWLGHVDDMPELFRSVQIVCLPSYREGLPKGLIEAAASGCALVTTDVPGCREVVSGVGDGLRVPVRNASALASAIARLQDEPGLVAEFGAAARCKALRDFDVIQINRRTVDVYRELVPFPP